MNGERVSGRRDLRGPLTAAVLGVAGIAVALIVGGGAATVVAAIAGVAGGLPAAVALIVAAGRLGPARRREATAARWLAAGTVAWLLGVGLRPVADGTSFVLTFADLLIAVGTVPLAVGCAMSAGPPARGRTTLRQVADGYLTAASLFVIGWATVLGAAYRHAEDSGLFYSALALPVLCLLVTCAVATLGAGPPRPVGRAGFAVLCAITVAAFATALARIGGHPAPVFMGLVAPVAFLVLAIVAWPVRGRRARALRRLPRFFVAGLPLGLVAAATVIVVVRFATGGLVADAGVLPVVTASIVLVLLVRLFAMVVEGTALRSRVEVREAQLRNLAESAGDVVLVCDQEGVIQEIGSSVEATYGYAPDRLVGTSITEYVHPEDVPDIESALRAFAADDDGPGRYGACRIACRIRASDGTWRPAESVATRYGRMEEHVLITTRDVSDRAALRDQVAHLTFHDGVTGLPNRAYFEERTREVIARPHLPGVAVIFLDLDGFTAVNDSVGHASGDYLLGQAARRLRGTVGTDDTLARWGGDEFAVLLETGGDAQHAVDLAERLVRAVSAEPFRVADRDVALTASVGVAFAEDDLPAGDLIRNADVAMAKAKEQGGRRVEVFAAHMHTDVVQRLELAADLQRALLEQQFTVEYQPVVDLATCRVTAVEALVRWWRGSTFVPPEQFLGPAEDTGVIVPLSEWILREACREVAAWRASSWDIGLSVNLSIRQINAPRFVQTVEAALCDSGLPASALTLEVVEEMLVEDSAGTIARLSELRALGVRLAIDDFGTGYASLAILRQLPVDMIKIDPSFVSGLGNDETLTLLTRTIVRLGHDLGLVVVAEGIERPEQLELLREMGCTRGQGYLVARPMAAQGVDSLMRTTLNSLQNIG